MCSVILAPWLHSSVSVVVALGNNAPWHMGSSHTRNRTTVPCIARQILNCWTTREAPEPFYNMLSSRSMTSLEPDVIFLHGVKRWGLQRTTALEPGVEAPYAIRTQVLRTSLLQIPNITRPSAWGTPSSTLAWNIPWMGEPGRLQSMGLQRVRQDWATSLSFFL